MNPLALLLPGFLSPKLKSTVSGWTKTGRTSFHLTFFVGRIVLTVEEERTHTLAVPEDYRFRAPTWTEKRWRSARDRDLLEKDETAASIASQISQTFEMFPSIANLFVCETCLAEKPKGSAWLVGDPAAGTLSPVFCSEECKETKQARAA